MIESRSHLLAIAIASVFISGCTLFTHLDLSGYPEAHRQMFLHNFTNESFEPDVNIELGRWVRQEIHRRDNFQLTDERSDARLWMYGEITVYRREGRMYDNLRTPIRTELIIACRVKLRQNPGRLGEGPGDTLLLSRELLVRGEYSTEQGVSENEFAARQRLLRVLAARINDVVETEFVNQFQPPAE